MHKYYVVDNYYYTRAFGPFWSSEAADTWRKRYIAFQEDWAEGYDADDREWWEEDNGSSVFVAEQIEPGANGTPPREIEQIDDDEQVS